LHELLETGHSFFLPIAVSTASRLFTHTREANCSPRATVGWPAGPETSPFPAGTEFNVAARGITGGTSGAVVLPCVDLSQAAQRLVASSVSMWHDDINMRRKFWVIISRRINKE
jgi:hypothetical protein